MKKFFLNKRKLCVIVSAVLGSFFAVVLALIIFNCFEKDITSNYYWLRLISSGLLIILAAPTSFYLWYLRNEDKLIQIQHQEEGNQFNNYNNALKLFTENNNEKANMTGLLLLLKLRNKGLFKEDIDRVTPGQKMSKFPLQDMNLEEADLTGVDLTGANLKKTNLRKAYLTGATLTEANLIEADLTGATIKDMILVIRKQDFNENENKISLDFFNKDFSLNPQSEDLVKVKIICRDGDYYFKKIKSDDDPPTPPDMSIIL